MVEEDREELDTSSIIVRVYGWLRHNVYIFMNSLVSLGLLVVLLLLGRYNLTPNHFLVTR